jgi:LCP family protein required for cell wall assembly
MKKSSQPRWIIAGLLVIILLALIGCLLFFKSPYADLFNITSYIKGSKLSTWINSSLDGNSSQCSDQGQWVMLMTGIDQRNPDYLYGLADVIRLVRIDFNTQQVNVVALPRALLVNPPSDKLPVTGPMLLNQAYFFGSPGMNYFQGEGYGAGSLAETIEYNFGIHSDHYVVVDFQAFINFVNAIGGIEVDLPTYVDDMPASYFPAGVQTLTGEQALTLARVRSKYSDIIRIDNQTIVLKAIFSRLKEPRTLTKLPAIYNALKDSYITDLSSDQISSLICLAGKVEPHNLNFFSPPQDLIRLDQVMIPNMNNFMQVFLWEQPFADWVKQSLIDQPVN